MIRRKYTGLVASSPGPSFHMKGWLKAVGLVFISSWAEREWEQHSEPCARLCRWPAWELSPPSAGTAVHANNPMAHAWRRPPSPAVPLVEAAGTVSVALRSQSRG